MKTRGISLEAATIQLSREAVPLQLTIPWFKDPNMQFKLFIIRFLRSLESGYESRVYHLVPRVRTTSTKKAGKLPAFASSIHLPSISPSNAAIGLGFRETLICFLYFQSVSIDNNYSDSINTAL